MATEVTITTSRTAYLPNHPWCAMIRVIIPESISRFEVYELGDTEQEAVGKVVRLWGEINGKVISALVDKVLKTPSPPIVISDPQKPPQIA